MKSAMSERIEREIHSHPVVLYMNGQAAYPLCSFSASIVNILSRLDTPFKDVNIVNDGDLRQALRDYADWPTFPQLYIKGEFIGGADIVQEMYESGELEEYLEKNFV
jgi:monothiol glutaredoxin